MGTTPSDSWRPPSPERRHGVICGLAGAAYDTDGVSAGSIFDGRCLLRFLLFGGAGVARESTEAAAGNFWKAGDLFEDEFVDGPEEIDAPRDSKETEPVSKEISSCAKLVLGLSFVGCGCASPSKGRKGGRSKSCHSIWKSVWTSVSPIFFGWVACPAVGAVSCVRSERWEPSDQQDDEEKASWCFAENSPAACSPVRGTSDPTPMPSAACGASVWT
mmetsp:Transcript_36380/g.71582  ORF Transcript_36380/g.71582 Transcript_36380/m.71582 type:complete len:217 (+) Transcript_36380:504-1154(+)